MREFLKKNRYEIKLIINLVFLTVLLSLTTFFILQNLSTLKLPTNFLKGKRVYILESYSTIDTYKKFGLNEKNFIRRVNKLKDELINLGFTTFLIDEKKLKDIPEDSALFLADTIGLENYTITQIEKFVKNGGKLLFNFKSGFNSIGKREYKKDYLISKITGFQYIDDFQYKINENKYATLKWLSPLNNQQKNTKFSLAIYDKLPIFNYPYWAKPDMIATKANSNRELNLNTNHNKRAIINSGVLWHGSYGKGKWVYFNFPAYTILDSAGSYDDFMKLLRGMFDYLFDDTILRVIPYYDKKSVITISGNFNYQYESIIQVNRLFTNYEIPITTFLSAKEVQSKPTIIKAIINNPLIEIASMGYISEKIAGKSYDYIKKEIKESKAILNSQKKGLEVSGFFPPKKAINASMIEVLGFNKYLYILDYNLKNYYPEFKYSKDILSIPVIATDSSYLTNVNIDSSEIIDNMIKEIKFINYINGIYSFNFNAHLMGYKNNILMLEEFLKKILPYNKKVISAKELYNRVKKIQNITITAETATKNIIVKIENRNEEQLNNFTFRVYIKPNHKILKVVSEYGLHNGSFKKIADMEYDITIKKLRRNSSSTYLIRYEKIKIADY